MKPVFQEFSHAPSLGVYGDCYRAAIASILELPREDVPHFLHDDPVDDVLTKRIDDWSKGQGLVRMTFWLVTDPRELMSANNPDVHYILGGETADGIGHVVVMLNDEMVHDPNPRRIGLAGPHRGVTADEQDAWCVEIFAPRVLKDE